MHVLGYLLFLYPLIDLTIGISYSERLVLVTVSYSKQTSHDCIDGIFMYAQLFTVDTWPTSRSAVCLRQSYYVACANDTRRTASTVSANVFRFDFRLRSRTAGRVDSKRNRHNLGVVMNIFMFVKYFGENP
jgi:hypothetical protein